MSKEIEKNSGDTLESVAALKAQIAEKDAIIEELNAELVKLGITLKKGKPLVTFNKKNYSLASPRFLHPETGAEVNIGNIGEILKHPAQAELLISKGALIEEGGAK
jgi:hypothetical protein